MDLVSRQENGVHVITAQTDRIDAAVAIQFKDRMRDATQEEADRVVLNLEQVEFIDSSGLGAIVASMKQMGSRKLELAGLSPTVEKVFRLTRMDTIFAIHSDIDAALERSSAA